MTHIRDIYDVIDGAAPFSAALEFDNVGLLVGDGDTPVTRVLLALDITPAVVEEAAALKAELVISHHPVIFAPLRSLSSRDVPFLLTKRGVAALCCHTNLDRSPVCGVNVALAGKLGLRNVRAEDVFGRQSVLFSGELEEPVEPKEFAGLVKERLETGSVQLMDGGRPVKKIFFCSGAGGDELSNAACRGADAFLTGELKHHEALEAARLGLTCVAAGHYETEKPFGAFLASYLKKRLPDVEFSVSGAERPPFCRL